MSKPLKQLMTDTLRRRYDGVESVCVVDLTGLNVGATTLLRRSLRQKSMRLEVVKNTIAVRAFEGGPLQTVGRSLRGPSALVTGGDSIIEVAKALVEAARQYKRITLKQAMIEGDPNLLTVADVARLKGRREMLAELAGLIGSPGRAVAGCIRGPQSRLAGCLKAIADKGESHASVGGV